MKRLVKLGGKLEEKKWIITSLAAGIAILAAVISIFVYMSKRDNQVAEFEEEDFFVD